MNLIDKNEVIERFYNPDEYDPNAMSFGRIVASLSDIKSIPEVDAVRVVRCKDCRNYNHGCYIATTYRGDDNISHTNPDDFCSFGKRNDESSEIESI